MPLQQTSVDLQALVPQQGLPMVAQNGMPFPGQHFLFEAHDVLPQHVLPKVMQNGLVSPGQHTGLLPLQAGVHVACASTELTRNVARMPPATKPPSRLSACRRGI